MADDIDDLLDEVEESLSRHSYTHAEDSNRKSVKTEDLTDLLDDFEPPPQPIEPRGNSRASNSAPASASSRKCYPLYLAGTSIPIGMSTGVTVRACNQLRCLECDCPVITFEGFTWTENTDYLFLRNNYPDTEKLRCRLDAQRGTRAYACQCQQRSYDMAVNISSEPELKWVCGKH